MKFAWARHFAARRRGPALVASVTVAGFLVLAAGAAYATTGRNGPTPPQLGDPIQRTNPVSHTSPDVSPHGGYSSSTNMCLQCHDVHTAAGGYALMYKASVTEVCGTCHMVMPAENGNCNTCHTGPGYIQLSPYPVKNPAPPPDPIGPGLIGTTSGRSAYDVPSDYGGSGHWLGATSIPDETGTITQADWTFRNYPPSSPATTPAGTGTAGNGTVPTGVTGGLYCGSCHTPHGDSGQLVNRWTAADEGRQIWWTDPSSGVSSQKYLHLAGSTWDVCDTTGNVNCQYAQVRDAEGQLVYLYGYKLLSSYPNHSYGTKQSYGTEENDGDGAKWCAACHTTRLDTSLGGAYHNHPTGCEYCHGNPSDNSSADFPHSSTAPTLLKDLPDGLCVSCHTGGLP